MLNLDFKKCVCTKHLIDHSADVIHLDIKDTTYSLSEILISTTVNCNLQTILVGKDIVGFVHSLSTHDTRWLLDDKHLNPSYHRLLIGF